MFGRNREFLYRSMQLLWLDRIMVLVRKVGCLCACILLNAILALGQSSGRPDDPAISANDTQPYEYITPRQRLNWFLGSTVGAKTLAAGLFTAGIGTARNKPYEYGPHWEGFAKRYGIRLSGVSTGNAIEASLGAIWGEDPRYFPMGTAPFKERISHIIGATFTAHNRQGRIVPAYARYIATPGNNFLSNAWRADSEANNSSAATRTLWGFVGLMGKNAFLEFWPDLRHHLFERTPEPKTFSK
jgi:hypothetical protein